MGKQENSKFKSYYNPEFEVEGKISTIQTLVSECENLKSEKADRIKKTEWIKKIEILNKSLEEKIFEIKGYIGKVI